jgi:ribosomal protein S3
METRWSCSITYFKSQIDYTHQRADTIYGVIGIKVWLFIGNKIIGKNSQSGGKNVKSKRTRKNATWTYEGKLAVITD